MPFELLVALRYLTARRKQAFISVISSISVLGVEKTGRQCEPFRIPGKMMSSKESAALARRIAQRDGEE